MSEWVTNRETICLSELQNTKMFSYFQHIFLSSDLVSILFEKKSHCFVYIGFDRCQGLCGNTDYFMDSYLQ